MSEPDDLGEEWWNEFMKELREDRFALHSEEQHITGRFAVRGGPSLLHEGLLMKQRTRITAGIMTGVYSVATIFGTVFLLIAIAEAPKHHPAPVTYMLNGVLVNILFLVGWVYLLKNRVWAWTMLVWLSGIFALGALALGLTMVSGSGTGSWLVLFMPSPFGWISIPALILLLTDKPSGWNKQQPGALPPDQQPSVLKKRTRAIAWTFLVVSVWSLAELPIAIMAFRHRPVSWVSGLLSSVLWVFWIALLRGRTWAWWTLVAAYTASSAWYAWGITQAPAYYATHHKALAHPWQAMIPGTVMLVLMGLVPLWALLADRPSGWANPQSEIRIPQ